MKLGGGPAYAIQAEIDKQPSLQGILPEAEVALIAVSDTMTGRLGVEAARVAVSRKATAVDVEDVHEADRILNAQANNEQRAWALGAAGMLIGTSGTLMATVLAPVIAAEGAPLTTVGALVLLCSGLYCLVRSSPVKLTLQKRK